jgi:hypothetical protein
MGGTQSPAGEIGQLPATLADSQFCFDFVIDTAIRLQGFDYEFPDRFAQFQQQQQGLVAVAPATPVSNQPLTT